MEETAAGPRRGESREKRTGRQATAVRRTPALKKVGAREKTEEILSLENQAFFARRPAVLRAHTAKLVGVRA
jgi:hypothetical protein